jgi:dsRNA-specific ribonuclease
MQDRLFEEFENKTRIYTFKDKSACFIKALTHSSYANEVKDKKGCESNESAWSSWATRCSG